LRSAIDVDQGIQDCQPIIADRAEFAEALHRLRRGHVMVRTGEGSLSCCIDGAPVHHSFRTLRDYGLIETFENRFGFAGIEYWRITDSGRDFADRVWNHWRARPRLERMVVRFTG
jgi:hypothetical protein